MFKNLNLHIEKLSLILPTIPGLPGPFNFSKLTGALKGFDTGLKGISFSIDLYSWKNDIKNAFSDVDLRVDIKSLWPTFPLDIEPLWPSFRQAKDKNKANQGDVFSKFNLDFGDVNIKAPDLDEIIRRVEQLRDFNDATKLRIDAEIKTALTHEFSGVVKDATGLTDTQISEVTGKIDEVYKEAKLGLEVTLISLYTLKATIAVVNAIKRGDGTVGTELEELLKKIPILQSEIKLIVDELKMLKEFGSKADLETIELLKKKLASKTQDLKSVKLNLFELKRMGEAFKALSDPRIVVDYKKPPLSDMLSGIKTENVKTIIDGANVVIRQAGKLSVAAIDSAVLAIELSETTATLVPLVDVIQNIDRKNIKSELEELIKEASKPVEKIAAENVKSELLKLNDTKKRLLELKDLSKRASEIPNLDFTHSTYSTVLQPLGLSGDMVTSFVKNAKEMSSKDIDAALSKLAIAEQPLKLGLLAKNIAVMEKAKPLLEFLKQPSTGGSNSDRIFQEWNSRAGAGEEPLDFFALRDAVKSVESLVNELEHPSFKVASPLITSEMEGIKEKLNGLVGNTDKQKAKQLFSSIYDFANAAAIAAVKAKAAALRIELKMDDVRYVSKAAPKPGALIEEHKKAMSDFVTHTEKLMRKFEAYRSLVRISNELKTKEVGNVTSSEFEAFEDFRRKAMGL
ncbi:MAG TPA: hypothetical protein VGU44_03530, partial [Gammaproteobacteria bacterium]|nr:hypothetical protein [Gammaproteobacteria bacterium]